MSISSYKILIEAVLSGLKYQKVPENKTTEESSMAHNHFSYSLKWIGAMNLTSLTSDKIMWNNVFELIVKYKNINSTEREENAQSFTDLLTAITGISGFLGFLEDAPFEDIDNKHSKGTIKIIIGSENNC